MCERVVVEKRWLRKTLCRRERQREEARGLGGVRSKKASLSGEVVLEVAGVGQVVVGAAALLVVVLVVAVAAVVGRGGVHQGGGGRAGGVVGQVVVSWSLAAGRMVSRRVARHRQRLLVAEQLPLQAVVLALQCRNFASETKWERIYNKSANSVFGFSNS